MQVDCYTIASDLTDELIDHVRNISADRRGVSFAIARAIQRAVLAEREACAKIADELVRRLISKGFGVETAGAAEQVAAEIRARLV